MPSMSQKQHNLMMAAAHGASDKVPPAVAREFVAADKASGAFRGGTANQHGGRPGSKVGSKKRKRVFRRISDAIDDSDGY